MCLNDNDKFTVDSKNGNGALTYPVGLITLDEVVLAGFNTEYSNKNDHKDTTNYLFTTYSYWTLSPNAMNDVGKAFVGRVGITGLIANDDVSVTYCGVRPVISLKNGTLVNATGDGTSTNPYVVE